MSALQDKFNAIVKKIENRIEDQELLDFVKQQIADIAILFIDQLDKVVDLSQSRLDELIEHEKEITKKVVQLEQSVRSMEKEFFVDENCDFEIVCPYCNYEFVSDFSQSLKEEVECPECHNIIELDWNNQEEGYECSGHCGCCASDCGQDEVEVEEEETETNNDNQQNQVENEDEDEDNEDDM